MSDTKAVTVRLVLADYKRLLWHTYTRPMAMAINFMIAIWLGVIFAYPAVLKYDDWSYLAIGLGIALVIRFGLMPVFEVQAIQFQTKRSHVLEQDIVLSLTPETVSSVRADAHVTYAWRVIKDVVRTPSAIYLVPSGGGTLIVPVAAFATFADAEAFYATTKAHWQAATA